MIIILLAQQKKQAVIELCCKEETASVVADKYGVERTSLYNWKKDLLGDKELKPMPKKKSTRNVINPQYKVNELNKELKVLNAPYKYKEDKERKCKITPHI